MRVARSIQKIKQVFGVLKQLAYIINLVFLNRFITLWEILQIQLYIEIYTAISSPLIEFVYFNNFYFLFYLNFILKTELSEIFIILGVFAFASVRLLPNLIVW